MSLFSPVTISCPSCGTFLEYDAVFSLNADRRPDLREAILDGSFQRHTCTECGAKFRLDPEMTYMDVGRGQWIAVFPVAKLDEWQALEKQTLATFAKAYGAKAPVAAREIGAGLKPRLCFGWAALREKIVANDANLDDLVVELSKAALVRGLDNPPVESGTEMRLIGIEGASLVFAWLHSADEAVKEILRAPRSLYDDLAADTMPWWALHTVVSSGPFADLNRLLLPEAALV